MTETEKQEYNDQRAAFIDALRELAALYEFHKEMPVPRYGTYLYVHDCSKEELVAIAKAVPRVEKSYTEEQLTLKVELGKYGEYNSPSLSLRFSAQRELVCEKVVTGTREVPEEYIPGYTKPAHTEEIVEWKCKPLLGVTDTEEEL